MLFRSWKGRVFAISAINGVGCQALTYAIMEHLDAVKKAENEAEEVHQAVLKKEAAIKAELKKAGLTSTDQHEKIVTDQ